MTSIFRPQKKVTVIPQATAMQKHRIRQVSSVRTHFPQMLEIEKDSEYQLKFKSSLGTEHTLYLQFPSNFPNDRPTVIVYPPLDHPWFDTNNNVVGFKQLNDFTMHQDLGKVLDILVRELSSFHPNSVPHREANASQFYVPHASYISGSPPVSGTPPPVPQAAPQVITTGREEERIRWINYEAIENLEIDRLKELDSATDEGQLLGFVDFEGFQAEGERERVRLLQENLELAQGNIQLKPFLEQERESLKMKQDTMQELLTQFRSLEQQQNKLMEFSEFRIMRSLEQLANDDNTEADQIAEDYLSGKIGLQTFLSDFSQKKESSCLRSAKQTKLQRILTDCSQYRDFVP
ncbi:Vacuolar protein sorting-associated protein 37A-like [Oopsacas minuta]|uniref:Vacuolar protein sorting-associated protein 37A-like n=1 Tax=Oopsacas minuta TaxID=111878 RepID=A0AAV7JD60_9METZ|nr:Vacuolar protein sorting-associated protein 37A-like [Oopsacas minuta]